MTKVLIAIMASAAFIIGSPVWAADTPSGGADPAGTLYKKILGQLPATVSRAISVTQAGDTTRITFDIEQLAQPMTSMGFRVSAKPITLIYTMLSDGTIKQTTDAPADVGLDYQLPVTPAQSGSFTYKGLTLNGIIDPKLAFYREMTGSVAKVFGNLAQEANGMSASVTAGQNGVVMKSEAVSDGVINIHQTQTITGFVERVHMDPSKATPPGAGPKMDIDFEVPDIKADIAIDSWNSFGVRDLVLFALNNSTKEEKLAKQTELKQLVHGLAPLLKSVEIGGEAHGVSIKSPFGQGMLGTIAVNMGLDARGPLGSIRVGERFDDIKVDSVFIPAWSKTLIPTAMDFEFGLTGLDFATGWSKAADFMDKYDFSDPKPDPNGLTPEAWGRTLGPDVVAPNGVAHVEIRPSSIVSPAFKIICQGSADVRGSQGKIHLDVAATGVDDVIKTLIQVRDKGAPEIVIGLYAAKALAKPGADGASLWAIDIDSAAGTLLVNGKPVGPQKKPNL